MDNLIFHGDDEAQKTETTALSHCYIALINTGMPISSLKSASGLAPPPHPLPTTLPPPAPHTHPTSNAIIQTNHVRHIDGVVKNW